jgi:alpha-amylase/alpha-mannosidase (GH57 family)
MHQPLYRLPTRREYYLGWTRLHAIKDYYGMAALLDKFSKVKATFNFSGVLLNQLVDYAYRGTEDYYGKLTLKDPNYLTKKERDFILTRFFSVNFERHIKPYPRYAQLYQKKTNPKKITAQDITDLQVFFNLSWFHPFSMKSDKCLRALRRKGRNFSRDDKQYIIDKQYKIISEIFPLYKRLLKEKRIEITITPFYHPILPLIHDTDILKEFSYLKRPVLRFSQPRDCHWHLERSKQLFKDIFEREVRGSWPSEGSISEGVAKIYKQEGFNWIGLDEGVLFKSLMTDYVSYNVIKNQRHLIYRPYNFEGLNMFFRDRNLSDAISFIYQGWDPLFASNDLLEHFKRIHYYTKRFFKKRAITIIMDGENAWEYYRNNGIEFLENVYANLEKSSILSTTLPQTFLTRGESKRLERLGAGSWINNDFGVWIGSKENNSNWHTLRRIRDLIEKNKKNIKNLDKLMEYFYIIEGSDWNWWNTFDEPSGDFKVIFLSYIKQIYKKLGKKVPLYLTKK